MSALRSPKETLAPALHPYRRLSAATSYSATVPQEDVAEQAKTDQRRANILVEATRDFSRLARPSKQDFATYKEFFYQFIENVSAKEKRIVAATLARVTFTPRPIALYLSMDKLEISAPFLLFSPVLGESDLRAIGRQMGTDYRRVMARRRGGNLAYVEFDALEERDSTGIKQPVISVPKAAEPSGPLSGDEIMALAGAGGRLGRSNKKAEHSRAISKQIESVSSVTDRPSKDELYALARKTGKHEFAETASRYTGLQAEEIMRLISNEKGDEIVYLIKAMDFAATKDIQVLLMLSPRYGRQLSVYRTAKNLLNELEVGICQMIFNKIGATFAVDGAPVPTKIEGDRTDNGFARAVGERQYQVTGSRAKLTSPRNSKEIFGRKAS